MFIYVFYIGLKLECHVDHNIVVANILNNFYNCYDFMCHVKIFVPSLAQALFIYPCLRLTNIINIERCYIWHLLKTSMLKYNLFLNINV